jgi:hypothetical protein
VKLTIGNVDSAVRVLRRITRIVIANSTTISPQFAMKMHRKRPETQAEMAQRRICESEVEVARQLELVLKLHSAGQSTELAEELLKEFEVGLRDDRRRLARMASSTPRNRHAV